MSVITEEMAIEYHKCSLYKEYIEQLQISEKNERDEFIKSLINQTSSRSAFSTTVSVFVAKYKYTKLQDQNGQCCMSKKDKVASLTPE